MKKALLGLLALPLLAACQDDARVASHNISKAADNFEIVRRVVFMNSINDSYLFEVVGRCSIEDQGPQLEVTCKEAPSEYSKHFFGKSDNTPYLVEQLGTVDVSVYHTRITFKPQAIIPDIDFRGDADELMKRRDTSD
ncbi:hypothetical protein [uncultured Roseibium sp.]|uniref:beta-sandwich lipoprotein n=1 Tax=uncultured Roseibium sp. TaxID=1936171 RepID=UPI0026268C66|nr:hypothetical protein [uncultured Roseibium sp.]